MDIIAAFNKEMDAPYHRLFDQLDLAAKLGDTNTVTVPFAEFLGGRENGPNLTVADPSILEETALADGTLASMHFWLTLKTRNHSVKLPGGRQFGYIKAKDCFQYTEQRNLETGKLEEVKKDIGKMFDLEPLYATAHQLLVADQAYAKVENNAAISRLGQQGTLVRAVRSLRREVAKAASQLMEQKILRPHGGTQVRGVSAVHHKLGVGEVAINRVEARKWAKKLGLPTVNGLLVLVIRHPVAELACATVCKLRVCTSKARVIWMNSGDLDHKGGDCDGDQIIITTFRDRELEFAGETEELAQPEAPTYFPRTDFTYASLKEHQFSTSVDRVIGLMTKGFVGRAFNLFERLAVLAAMRIPMKERMAFAKEHGFEKRAKGHVKSNRKWTALITAVVKDSAAAVYEIIMDYRKFVTDQEPERFSTALTEVMELASGIRQRLDTKTFECATDRLGNLLLKEGQTVPVQKDGRTIDAQLINAIMGLIDNGKSLKQFLADYPFQGLLVGGRNDAILGRALRAIHTDGVDKMISILNGEDIEPALVPEEDEFRGIKPLDRRVPPYFYKPRLDEYVDGDLWGYVLDVANWFDYKKGRTEPAYQYPEYNRRKGAHKNTMLVLPTVGSMFMPYAFERVMPKDMNQVGGIKVTSRGEGNRIARLVFRCANKNVNRMSIRHEEDIKLAIQQDDIHLETILDVLGERIATACRKNAFLLERGEGDKPHIMEGKIKTIVKEVIEEFSVVKGQTDDEIVDGETPLVLLEAQVELPEHRMPAISMDLCRRMLSLIDATESGRPRLHAHPFMAGMHQRYDVGVSSKNAPGKVVTLCHHQHGLASIIAVANLTRGNFDRICRESRTVRFARNLVNGGKIVMTNGRENEIPGLIGKAVDAVWIFVESEVLVPLGGKNPDMGVLFDYGAKLYERSRRTPIISRVTKAQADIRAKEVLDDPKATMEDLLLAGWRVEEGAREVGKYQKLPTYEPVYTLIGPAPSDPCTWAKIYGFGGHKFVAPHLENTEYYVRRQGKLVPVAGMISIQTAKSKKLDEAMWAGLCGLYGKRDFAGVTYQSLEAEGKAILEELGDDLLPLARRDEDGSLVDAGFGMAGLFRTFVLKEDENISSACDIATPHHTGSRSSNLLFTRLIGEESKIDPITRKHLQTLADAYMDLGNMLGDLCGEFGIEDIDALPEVTPAGEEARPVMRTNAPVSTSPYAGLTLTNTPVEPTPVTRFKLDAGFAGLKL